MTVFFFAKTTFFQLFLILVYLLSFGRFVCLDVHTHTHTHTSTTNNKKVSIYKVCKCRVTSNS
jgi:hypothetical protein